MTRKEYIQVIIDIEWQMFDQVENNGGRAACQNDRQTFVIMRESQFVCWTDAMLASYYGDLMTAQEQGRNLLSEKYARMMASTHPQEYQEICHLLPPIAAQTAAMIETIVQAHVAWKRTMREQYPKLAGNGRLLTTEEDTMWETSFETYLRGEIATYSTQTIALYAQLIDSCIAAKRNLAEENLQAIAARYGYSSLSEAEKNLESR